MRKLLIFIPFIFFAAGINSQQLSQVTFSGGTSLSYFSFLTNQGVLIRIAPDGKMTEWGTEVMSDRYNYYAPKLQPFMGRVDYYGPESDSVFRGKIKSIGTCSFTYYGAYEKNDIAGKLKSIGTIFLEYYSDFDEKSLRGKIKMAGSQMLAYYSPTDDEAFRGKLKSIGSTNISYYSSFDDKLFRGKIKNIGSVSYTWYSSFDRSELRGSLKSGRQRQNIGSVTYILW